MARFGDAPETLKTSLRVIADLQAKNDSLTKALEAAEEALEAADSLIKSYEAKDLDVWEICVYMAKREAIRKIKEGG